MEKLLNFRLNQRSQCQKVPSGCLEASAASEAKGPGGAGQGGAAPPNWEGWGTAQSLGAYLQLSFTAEPLSELNQPYAQGPC